MLVRMRAHMTRSFCSCMCAWRTRSTTGNRMHRDSAATNAMRRSEQASAGNWAAGGVSFSVFTWVHVKLALHRLGDALQFDGLQGAVRVDGGGQAAQRLPDEAGHLAHREDLQQLAVYCRECPQEHRLGGTGK